MLGISKTFGALYLATLLMQLGATLLISYLALRLNAEGASEFWIGALMAANALGMALGGSAGRALIERAGHVRAYAASAGVIVAAVLAHELSAALPVWLLLRGVAGMAMMCQLMVLESWLNDRAAGHERGRVLALYMVATYVGMVLGQLSLGMGSGPDTRALLSVAIAFSLCLVPVALTRSIHPAALAPSAGTAVGLILRRIPQPLLTILVSGMLNGSFFGLGAIYAREQAMSTGVAAVFLAMPVAAGLVAQFPLGLLSDRFPRVRLIRGIAALLVLASMPLAFATGLTPATLSLFAFCLGALQFCLYPLGAALANEQIEPELRVALAGVVLTTFGIGSCIGPLVAGAVMERAGAASLYVFIAACAAVLALAIRQPRGLPMAGAGRRGFVADTRER